MLCRSASMTDSAPIVQAEPIRLNFKDADVVVVVTPEDEDRFMTTAAEAAYACKQAQDMLQWKREFDKFLRYIHRWCERHDTQVSHAYLAFSADGLNVFILTRGSEYRFDFDDTVTGLDAELVRQYPRCPAELMLLPETPDESLTSFFAPGTALQLYGD